MAVRDGREDFSKLYCAKLLGSPALPTTESWAFLLKKNVNGSASELTVSLILLLQDRDYKTFRLLYGLE